MKYKVTTPIPKQFLAKGTLTWKAIEFKNKNTDAIVGQNLLIPLQTKIDNENRSIEIFGNKICAWIGPYISIHFLSLNLLLVCRRRYSRGERYPRAL